MTHLGSTLGKLLTAANTAGGGTITYRYDLAGALISQANTGGTSTYSYDAAHQLTLNP
ncbi:MAG: hypothetical protein DLM58_24325 [Pseudonocardiales bacterium]|nr:MAG: hypothetical protein DLM58_24325 [Pseudonocardiales bacterium]